MMDIIFEILLSFVADTLQIKFSVIMCMYDLRQVLETKCKFCLLFLSKRCKKIW